MVLQIFAAFRRIPEKLFFENPGSQMGSQMFCKSGEFPSACLVFTHACKFPRRLHASREVYFFPSSFVAGSAVGHVVGYVVGLGVGVGVGVLQWGRRL